MSGVVWREISAAGDLPLAQLVHFRVPSFSSLAHLLGPRLFPFSLTTQSLDLVWGSARLVPACPSSNPNKIDKVDDDRHGKCNCPCIRTLTHLLGRPRHLLPRQIDFLARRADLLCESLDIVDLLIEYLVGLGHGQALPQESLA